ncbi:MAG: zinc dependent phospholipase C family protein [Eubacteriales bacterium]
MPAFYTHARFGKEVLEQLKPEVRAVVDRYPELFYIGLQGPDILFYHKAYKKNTISQIGYAQHGKPGSDFFQPARKIIADAQNKEAAFCYAAGFICHFTLDSQCHPYIATVEAAKKLSHTEIEAEEDRYLMVLDGKDCLRHIEADKVVISAENAEVISWFFEGVSEEDVSRSLRHLRFFCHMFCAPGRVKRSIVSMALKIAGKYDSMAGMLVNYEENQACHESTMKIAQLSQEVIPLASQLIEEYQLAVEDEGEMLHERYEHTFGE